MRHAVPRTLEERVGGACLSLLAIPIVYFEKNRVFKAGNLRLEYISMG
jgi:hypothetical protein